MNGEQEQFDDPALKAAVKRAWGNERAPEALQARLRASMFPPIHRPQTTPWLGIFAAAALILIVCSLAIVLFPKPVAPISQTLASDMAATHDRCCVAKNHHHLKVASTDFPAMAQVMASKINRPVLAANLPGNWKFKGASICNVGKVPAAHLVFSKEGYGGDDHVSLFSLPNSESSKHLFESSDARHPAAGFVKDNAFICVVGSSSHGTLSVADVAQLRDQLRSMPLTAPAVAKTDQPDSFAQNAGHRELLVPID